LIFNLLPTWHYYRKAWEVINNFMTNTSILSEKCNETGIYIQGNFKKGMCKSRMNGIDSKVVAKKGKVIVKTIFQTSGKNENLKEKLTYTIQKGDDKRLCREGVLRVYNIKEPIDIPIINLLGKWKNTHIGITLFVLNGQWYAGKEFVENLTYKQERGVLTALRLLLRFAIA